MTVLETSIIENIKGMKEWGLAITPLNGDKGDVYTFANKEHVLVINCDDRRKGTRDIVLIDIANRVYITPKKNIKYDKIDVFVKEFLAYANSFDKEIDIIKTAAKDEKYTIEIEYSDNTLLFYGGDKDSVKTRNKIHIKPAALKEHYRIGVGVNKLVSARASDIYEVLTSLATHYFKEGFDFVVENILSNGRFIFEYELYKIVEKIKDLPYEVERDGSQLFVSSSCGSMTFKYLEDNKYEVKAYKPVYRGLYTIRKLGEEIGTEILNIDECLEFAIFLSNAAKRKVSVRESVMFTMFGSKGFDITLDKGELTIEHVSGNIIELDCCMPDLLTYVESFKLSSIEEPYVSTRTKNLFSRNVSNDTFSLSVSQDIENSINIVVKEHGGEIFINSFITPKDIRILEDIDAIMNKEEMDILHMSIAVAIKLSNDVRKSVTYTTDGKHDIVGDGYNIRTADLRIVIREVSKILKYVSFGGMSINKFM